MSKAMEAATDEDGNPSMSDAYSWISEYEIEPSSFSSSKGDAFHDGSTPHEPPLYDVELKLASDIEILHDEELVDEVVNYWFPSESDRLDRVIAVFFNDASVWYLPTASWEKDYEGIREHVVETFVPDVVQWKALVEGRDPSKALSRFRKGKEIDDPEWESEMSNTSMSEEHREWFNSHADWMPHIDRQVESNSESIDLDVEDEDSWADDW
jgi:hypothetical protein